MIFTEPFIPFFGVVEDVNDPEKLGRVRVRAHGYHPENQNLIPTDQLPWMSSIVSNSAGVHGGGDSPTGYALQSTVFGYFLDRTYQVGIVVGSLVGMTNGTSDLSGLANQNPNHPLYDLRERNSVKEIQEPAESKTEWREPPYVNNSTYPNNQVYESAGGLIREMDSTIGEERIHEYHPSGTYYEVRPDGTRTVKVVGDGYELIAGDKFVNVRGTVNVTYEGNVNQFIKGNLVTQISGDKTEIVMGDVKEYYADQTTQVNGTQTVKANEIIQSASMIISNPGDVDFDDVPVTHPKEYDLDIVRAGLIDTGRHQEFDETETIIYTPSDYPPDVPPSTYDGNPKQESSVVADGKDTPELGDCMVIDLPINYSLRLSPNYTIGNLSTGALFPHSIISQRGLSEAQIICNLQQLAINIIEPLREEFGPFRINSCFRRGNGKSQHNVGQAVDIQQPTWSAKKHLEVAEWALKNLPVDQLILEHGRSIWLHLSFDPNKTKQRGQAMTMIGGKYQSGFKLYY